MLLGLKATGAIGRLRRDGRPTILPELPDMVKPLVLLPVWLLVGGVLFLVLGYAFPEHLAWNALLSTVTGLAVAVLLVEEPTLRELARERRAERERRASMRERRRESLAKKEG